MTENMKTIDYPYGPNVIKENNNKSRTIIIIIVLLIVLCCCCSVSTLGLAWFFGDKLMEMMGSQLPLGICFVSLG